ncbi:MAG: hypothetical protein FWG46_05810 [Treponema sp.]|nr:hypothetical protein [Treponema sp.]
MKMKSIENYRRTRLPVTFIPAEPIHPVFLEKTVYPAKQRLDSLLQGFPSSSNAEEIDRGIRDTIKGIRVSILAMGLGLARIKAMDLYMVLNCQSMPAYIDRLSKETKMYRGSIYNWLYIGEAYIKYKNDLERIGFSDSDGPSKLPYLDRALASNRKKEVFNNIKSMSLREFASFARAKEADSIPAASDKHEVAIRGNTVYVDGRLAIIISAKIDNGIASYFKKAIHAACEALEKGDPIETNV